MLILGENMPKTKIILKFLGSLLIIFLYILSFQQGYSKDIINDKRAFVSITKFPDLAISTESLYIRHRSLSDVFHIFKDDPLLLTYTPSTFTISHSHYKY